MKHIVALVLAFFLVGPAHASKEVVLETCTVTKVTDDNVFEEGLSRHEYPDLDIARKRNGYLDVDVGAMSAWDEGAGSFIWINKKAGSRTTFYYFQRKTPPKTKTNPRPAPGDLYQVAARTNAKTGARTAVLSVMKRKGRYKRPSKIAEFNCQ